jgi:integrase/recombinase XerD
MPATMPNAPGKSKIADSPADCCRSKCPLLAGYDERMELSVPVEYAVAVDQYLDLAAISDTSRRVYHISLANWAWPLIGKPIPRGQERRGAAPPVLPLAVLDDPGAGDRLATQFAARAAVADTRTANRELSALRSAVDWWREQGWIRADPTAGLRHRHADALEAPLSHEQVHALFLLPASLREQALWRVLYDSGASAAQVLALDADHLDLSRHRVRPRSSDQPPGAGIEWREGTSQLLHWLLAARMWGPVFVTDRRAPARAPVADVCRVTGQARMSYRRAAEIFTALTRPLDTASRGWTLHQLSAAGRTHQISGVPPRPRGCRG